MSNTNPLVCQIKSYGRTFKEIQISNRIRDVELYLSNSSLTISEIAELTGFSNLNQLYREFKTKHGILPKAYRETEKYTKQQ